MNLLAVFLCLLAYYYFVLRKYNTLGFRLFSLCFFVSAAVTYWWWIAWRELKRVEHGGVSVLAEVREKRRAGSTWVVAVAFRDATGTLVIRECRGGMSDGELAEVLVSRPTPIRYSPESRTFFLERSFQRQNRDLVWLSVFPASLFLLGVTSWFFLRRYRVHPHEGTVYEYVTDETGRVVLDDAKNEAAKNLKKATLIAKVVGLLLRR